MQVQPNLGQNILSLGQASGYPPLMMIPAGNPDGIFTLSLGGQVSTNNYCIPFLKNGALAQVPVGKKWKVLGVVFMCAAAGVEFQLISSTATFAYDAAVAALTAPVYQNGASSRHCFRARTSNTYENLGVQHEFSASTWPGIQVSTAANAMCAFVICKEEAA